MEIDLAKSVNSILNAYKTDMAKVTNAALKAAAREAVSDLKSTSPNRTGDYAQGWTSQMGNGFGKIEGRIVYNRTDWQLTHLLEDGHLNRDGSKTEGIPHIAPAEERAVEALMKRLEGDL